MNEFLQVMMANFSPQIAIAVFGGLIGGFIGIDDKMQRYGKRLAFLLVTASVIFSGAVVDYMATEHEVKSMFICMAIGVSVGIFSGHLMDALRLASPRLADKLVNEVGDVTIARISNKTKGDDNVN